MSRVDEDWLDESGADVDDALAPLGEPIAEFAVHPGRVFRNLLLAPLLIVVGLGLDVGMLFFIRRVHAHLWHVFVLGAFLATMGFTLVRRALQNRGLRVVVYPEGLVRLQNGRAQAFLWDEITHVQQKRAEGFGWSRAWHGALVLTLQRGDDKMIFDDALPDIRSLVTLVERETLPHLLPKALAAYQAGKEVNFGRLRVSPRDIHIDDQGLTWDEVQRCELKDGKLVVYRKGKGTALGEVPIIDLPNGHVFVALADQTPELRQVRR